MREEIWKRGRGLYQSYQTNMKEVTNMKEIWKKMWKKYDRRNMKEIWKRGRGHYQSHQTNMNAWSVGAPGCIYSFESIVGQLYAINHQLLDINFQLFVLIINGKLKLLWCHHEREKNVRKITNGRFILIVKSIVGFLLVNLRQVQISTKHHRHSPSIHPKIEGSGDIIPTNFLDFPPNFRLRTRF